MRKLAIFLFASAAGTFVSAAWHMVQQHSWWFAVVYLLFAFGFTVVAWYHLGKLKEGS